MDRALEQEATKRIEHARLMAVLETDADRVFFSECAMRLQPKVSWTCKTLATDGKTLLYNPSYVKSLSMEELYGVAIGHETMHCSMLHFARFLPLNLSSPYEHYIANIAADLEINPLCLSAKFVLPKGGVMPGQAPFGNLPSGKTMGTYYTMLLDSGYGKQGDGKGGFTPSCGEVIPSEDQAEASEASREWQDIVAAAQTAAMKRGELSAGLRRLIDSVLKPKYNPWVMLEDYLLKKSHCDLTWMRPNRRYMSQGIIMPTKHGRELGDVVIMFDLSGSITNEQARMMAWTMESVISRCSGKVTMLYHDVEVNTVKEWESGDEMPTFSGNGGGGTSHIPAFEKIDELDIQPTVVVAVTDMESEFPKSCDYPTVWLATENNSQRAPFGDYMCMVD